MDLNFDRTEIKNKVILNESKLTLNHQLTFNWSVRTVGEWRELLKSVPQSNWMQSWPYAQAIWKRDFKKTRIATIEKFEKIIGLFFIQEIHLGPIHFIELQRGPLWFKTQPDPQDLREFAQLFSVTFPTYFWRRRRWLAEYPQSLEAESILTQSGFQKMKPTFKTTILNLEPGVNELRSQLKQKWRNGLNKSEKLGLELKKFFSSSLSFDLFLRLYQKHLFKKNYHGPSPLFIKEEIQEAQKYQDAFIFWAIKDGIPVAGLYILRHGCSASYRIGWNSPQGRLFNAHSFLLWQSILELKKQNIKSFDLGGILPSEAEGLTHFKQGLNGEEFSSLGLWR